MVYSFLFSYTSWSVNGKHMIFHPSCIQGKVLKMKQLATIFIPISGNTQALNPSLLEWTRHLCMFRLQSFSLKLYNFSLFL